MPSGDVASTALALYEDGTVLKAPVRLESRCGEVARARYCSLIVWATRRTAVLKLPSSPIVDRGTDLCRSPIHTPTQEYA